MNAEKDRLNEAKNKQNTERLNKEPNIFGKPKMGRSSKEVIKKVEKKKEL